MQLSKTQKGIIGLLAVAAAGYSYIPSVCSKAKYFSMPGEKR